MAPDHLWKARFAAVYVVLGSGLVLVAALALTLVYVSHLQNDVEQTTLRLRSSCNRGNVVRSQVTYNTSVLQSFLAQAAATREQTADLARREGDTVTARLNRDAAAAYRALARGLTPIPLVDCEAIIK